MTRARVAAAMAGILTALLLQASLIAPVTTPFPISLPAVVVAAVALKDGPATGMSFGFAAGLTADLGSHHPAGVLALVWLGVGLLCGLLAERRGIVRDAVTAGTVCGLASGVAAVLLQLVRSGGSVRDAVAYTLPSVAGDIVLAVLVVALVRRMLTAESLRAPRPALPELRLESHRG